jgi:hydroxymethylpyrimidine/phosphomethylpyrimidine kinase
MHKEEEMPVVLSISGSDSGGGDGIQADLRTFAANGVYGTTAITCLTAQNPAGVSAVKVLSDGFVREQIEQVNRFFKISAIKTGLLVNADIISTVADFLSHHPDIPVVVDPVMSATCAKGLLDDSAIETLELKILPRAALIIPNIDEAALIIGQRATSVAEMEQVASKLANTIGVPVLLKGGHLTDLDEVTDILAMPHGELSAFTAKRIGNVNTHGSGCTLSSAIAANLARQWELTKAIGEALTYLRRGLRQPLNLNGESFVQH